MSFASSMTVILAWNLSSKDLRIFLTILDYAIDSPRLKVEFTISLSLAFLIKGLILLHPYLFKTTSESLKLHSLYYLGTLIGGIKNGPCFLGNFRGWYFLEFFIGHPTKQGIQGPTVEICSYDCCIIPIHWRFLWLNPANFNSLPYLFT